MRHGGMTQSLSKCCKATRLDAELSKINKEQRNGQMDHPVLIESYAFFKKAWRDQAFFSLFFLTSQKCLINKQCAFHYGTTSINKIGDLFHFCI